MEKNTELSRLEQFVETLLGKYNTLKQQYHDLDATLRERDAECAGLQADLARLREERAHVGSRVSSLLDRIEQWEAVESGENGRGQEPAGVQGSLFGQQEAV